MNKKFLFALALAVVLVSGAFAGALADCAYCSPQFSAPSCYSGNCAAMQRDYDKPDATCQGAYRYGPVTPDPMGSPGW